MIRLNYCIYKGKPDSKRWDAITKTWPGYIYTICLSLGHTDNDRMWPSITKLYKTHRQKGLVK